MIFVNQSLVSLVPSIARIVQAVQTMQFNLKCAKNLKDEIEKFVELEKIGNNDKEVRFHNKIQVKNLTFKYNLENDKKNLNIYHISHIPNDSYLRKLKLKKNNDIKKSDLILASSIKPGESLKNYKKTLDFAIKKNIPMFTWSLFRYHFASQYFFSFINSAITIKYMPTVFIISSFNSPDNVFIR